MLNHSPMKEFLWAHNFLVIWHNIGVTLRVYRSGHLKRPLDETLTLALKY